jgi:hypothetical protein
MDEDEKRETPKAWRRAVARFEMGYGALPDFDDPEDQFLFLQIVEDQLREAWSHDLTAALRKATARLRAATPERAP